MLLVLVGVRAVAGQVFAPASRAAVPALVAGRDLETANATVGCGANGAEAVGPLLAAAMLLFLGVPGVLLVDAASFVVSAVLLARLPALSPAADRTGPAESLLGLQGNPKGKALLLDQVDGGLVLAGYCLALTIAGVLVTRKREIT